MGKSEVSREDIGDNDPESSVAPAQPKTGKPLAVLSEQPVATFLVAPSVILRAGLEECLAHTRFSVAASGDTFDQVRATVVPANRQTLLLIDASIRHEEALRAFREFQEAYPDGRTVMLVQTYDPHNLIAAYRQGVDGYLTTTMSREVLLSHLALVMLGEVMIPSAAFEMVIETSELQHSVDSEPAPQAPDEPWDGVDRRSKRGLTFREASILRCLMDGDSNKVIARKCDIAEATVKVHVKVILRKINAKNRTQAALWATAHLERVERRMKRY